jgi:subtilisin family serine protease
MARHARPRRGPSPLRLEILEPRTLLSSTPSGAALAAAPGLARGAAVQAQNLVPDDPGFKQQWGLSSASTAGIDALQAWSRTTGNPSTIVAVLDTGIDLANPEFAGHIWTNPDSSGDAGYPGDVHGWNFVANDANVQDDNGHGTHVAGIIAAAGNNGIGVAGVDWNAEIMPLKVLDASGNGSDDAMARAIDFAVQHGARVINASWGGGSYSQEVADAIAYAGSQGVVFVTAAGNSGASDDTQPFYPASYHLPNEIAVAAVDSSGNLASFSNYGAQTVALAAPGVSILSTIPGGYAYESGTSMAAPFVTGVVALVAGLHPSDTAVQLVHQVLSTTKPLASLAGKTTTGGIVDAARAVGHSAAGSGGWLQTTRLPSSAAHPASTVVTTADGPHHPQGAVLRHRSTAVREVPAGSVSPPCHRPAIRIRPGAAHPGAPKSWV